MEAILNAIKQANDVVNDFVWGPPMLLLLLFVGIYFSIRLRFFQIRRFGHVFKETICSTFSKKQPNEPKNHRAITQFQALSTALASTIGTGNIVGVATAMAAGGPGAVFWMWVSAFFGMMTHFAENVLGIFYRHKNQKGEWCGGAMIYIEKGLHCKWLAVLFSVFCLFASFGIGNIAQINSISTSLETSLSIPPIVTGIVLAAVMAIILIGGLKRIAAVAEKLVPFMALVYILGALIIIGMNAPQIPAAFASIFKSAFSFESIGGGIMGYGISLAIRYGVARGVFSNEAGLGSSVMVHSAADVKEPVKQGLWGIFEVFVDTIIVCTLTALVILCTGALDIGGEGAEITMNAFTNGFGSFGGIFLSLAILLFAFTTALGWSYYGQRAVEYLFGSKAVIIYQILFIGVIVIGSISTVQLVWDLSDTFNGLMALPNLIGVLLLSPKVIKITKNYIARRFKQESVKPVLSVYDDEADKKQ